MESMLPCTFEVLLLTLKSSLKFPCGRVKRFLKNNTQNKMRVGAKGEFTEETDPWSSILEWFD